MDNVGNERIYLGIFNAPKIITKKKPFEVDIIRAETISRAKEAFEEVECLGRKHILQLQDITGVTPDKYYRERKIIGPLIQEGKDNFVYFNPFADKWRKRKETVKGILSLTSINPVDETLVVGLDLRESKAYVRDIVDMVTIDTGLKTSDVKVMNALIRNSIDNSLMLNLIAHRLKPYSADNLIFLYANEYPYKKDIKTIFKQYPNAKVYCSIETSLFTIDRDLNVYEVRV